MKAPKFGIAFSFQAHRGLGEPYDKAYREGLELAAEASRLGYHSVWASEHHFSPDQWNPSPFTFLAAVFVDTVTLVVALRTRTRTGSQQ